MITNLKKITLHVLSPSQGSSRIKFSQIITKILNINAIVWVKTSKYLKKYQYKCYNWKRNYLDKNCTNQNDFMLLDKRFHHFRPEKFINLIYFHHKMQNYDKNN